MIRLIKIAPFLFSIQTRRVCNFIKRRKAQILFFSIMIILILFYGKLDSINVDLSNDLLFIFLLISFLPLFQNIPEIIINSNLILLKLIDFAAFKLIYFYKAIFKPFLLIVAAYIVVPLFTNIDIERLLIILLIRMSIACHTFIMFQTKNKNTNLLIICCIYLLSYSLRSSYLILALIIAQNLFILSKRHIIYEDIVDIYRSIFRLRQGISTDLDGFVKAQETIAKKAYKKHKNYLITAYDSKYYYFKLQFSRIIADQSFYLPECFFAMFLTLCYKLFDFDKSITLITILIIVFNVLSQLINPIFGKVKQGLCIPLNHLTKFQIFIIPSFLISLPFTISMLIICNNPLSTMFLQLLLSLSFLLKEKSKLTKFIFIILTGSCILTLLIKL